MRILVAGSTGYLGSRIVAELGARGHVVRGLARGADRSAERSEAADEFVAADVTDPAALRGCCDGVDVVVSTVGLVGKAAAATVWDVDYQGNLNLLDEAVRAGVRRFVYTSVVRSPSLEPVVMVRAKRAFERQLREADIDHTILYPNGYFSDMDEFLAMARRGRAFVFGRGGYRINPVDGVDVAVAAADAVESTEPEAPLEVEIGGPEVLTHEQIAELAFAAVGTEPKVVHVPTWVGTTARVLARRLTPVRVHASVEFLLAVLTHDVVTVPSGRRRLADHFASAVDSASAQQPHGSGGGVSEQHRGQ